MTHQHGEHAPHLRCVPLVPYPTDPEPWVSPVVRLRSLQ
jgi:hypothetical protein